MIQPRAPENRLAYLEGFEAAVAMIEKHGTAYAREFLRLNAEVEKRLNATAPHPKARR